MEPGSKCIIVDDDFFSLSYLKSGLAAYNNLTVTGFAMNARDGSELILKTRPDLVFLDVELPDASGLDLLRYIKEKVDWPFHVVFYSAYNKYLLEALRESAFDYLLKPFEKDDLDQVLIRYFEHLKKEQKKNSFISALTHLLPENSGFMISTINGFQILRLEEIGYFKYLKDRKQWLVVLSNHKELQLKRNTNARDILKYSPSFVQINRDQVININYLSIIRGNECILFPPFEQVGALKISSGFIRLLQDKFSQI
jgi:two-component system, LytTR family, response regulator